ncbi:MAG TPA: hypothetical protein PLJ47_01970 [Candidatus Hydrogenedentes bacterium]|nr:hypothetical protein [Candidatus Hydrogenedentota bacterium]HRK33333.1 hypothetical protein [Candidatus Hydrogenedentota bacterium]
MGEPKEKEGEGAAHGGGGGGGKTIVMALVSSLISVCIALGVFYVMFMPKLAEQPHGEEGEEEEAHAEEDAGGGHGGGHGEEPVSLTITFDEATSTVIMPSPDMPASILVYKVAMDCGNSSARTLVEANKSRFTAKIRELHSYKKREELDNPQLEQDILKAVVQESNAILQELLGKPSEKTRVVAAYHEKFFIQDM